MVQIEDRWPKVKRILTEFHIPDHHTVAIQTMRAILIQEASRGTPPLPDHTLHNADHSDNLVFLLDQLRTNLRLNLSPYEAYLLTAGIYLHDVGMYISTGRFEQDILPNWQAVLPFCPEHQCDHPSLYKVRDGSVGDQIRELHNLLSAHCLLRFGSTYGITTDDLPYVMQIVRGHRRVDLTTRDCDCYRADLLDDQSIRVGLLASLVRLVDAMDFARNRAPERIFRSAAPDFLQNPTALEHWTKHYFAKSSEVCSVPKGSESWLVCTAHFAVPRGQLNGRSYKVFFEPLIAAHVDNANSFDLNIRNHPAADLHDALGVKVLRLDYAIREQVGFKDLPPEIVSSIEESQVQDALAFTQWLKATLSHPASPLLRVLYLEDEPRIVEALASALEDRYNGLEVVRLTSITDALARLTKEEFGAVLLGISMSPTKSMDFNEIEYGQLTNVEIARRIKKVKPDIPIVALTVVSDSLMRRETHRLDVHDIIEDPAGIDGIAQVLLGTRSQYTNSEESAPTSSVGATPKLWGVHRYEDRPQRVPYEVIWQQYEPIVVGNDVYLRPFVEASPEEKQRCLWSIWPRIDEFSDKTLHALVSLAIHDSDPRIRGEACHLVGEWSDVNKRQAAQFEPQVRQMSQYDSSSWVRRQATDAASKLVIISECTIDLELFAAADVYRKIQVLQEVSQRINDFDAETLQALLDSAFSDPDPVIRGLATRLLQTGSTAGVGKYARFEPQVRDMASHDPDLWVRSQAITAALRLFWPTLIQREGRFVLLYIILGLILGFVVSLILRNVPLAFGASVSSPCESPYARSIVQAVGVENGSQAIGARDGAYANVGLEADSVLILDMGPDNPIVTGPGIDFYYYERPNGPGIHLDAVQVSVAQDDDSGNPGPPTTVFVWGDNDPTNNGAIPTEYFEDGEEIPDTPIDSADLYNRTGIGIDIRGGEEAAYRFVRIQTYPSDFPVPDLDLLAEIDAIEKVCHPEPPMPTATETDTPVPPTATPMDTPVAPTATQPPTSTPSQLTPLTDTPTVAAMFTPSLVALAPSTPATIPPLTSAPGRPTPLADTPTPTFAPSPAALAPSTPATILPPTSTPERPILSADRATVAPTSARSPMALLPSTEQGILVALLTVAMVLPVLWLLVLGIAGEIQLWIQEQRISKNPEIAHPLARELPRLRRRLELARDELAQLEEDAHGAIPSLDLALKLSKKRALVAELEEQIVTIRWSLEDEAI